VPVPETDGASCQEELPSSKLESEIIVLGLGASENIQVIHTGGNSLMSFSTGVLNPAGKDQHNLLGLVSRSGRMLPI